MKACNYCKGTGLDPACDWDILEGEERCDPTHACPFCAMTYHLNEEGKPHLKGHCDGRDAWIRHPSRRYLEHGLGVCSGCEELIPDDGSEPHELCHATL